MEALKFLGRVLVVLTLMLRCVNADRDIKCDGRDFECDGAYRFVTCVYLSDGQKLYQPKQCESGTVCNSNNLPEEPCDFSTVPSSTISTAPTSTADRATTLKEVSTLPYVRPTKSPESLLSEGDGEEVRSSRRITELDIHNETSPLVDDSMKVSFGVNITGDLDALGSNTTNVTTLMSIEPPSSIKTSSKVVFEKPEFIKETTWKGPVVKTNTTIENIKKQSAITQISINTLMEAVFRFPVLQTQNVITFSNMNVMRSDNSSISVNVATDVAGTEMNSDRVAVTTNTTVSFGSLSKNNSIGYLSEPKKHNGEEVRQNVNETVHKSKSKHCTKCREMNCSHIMEVTNEDNVLVPSGNSSDAMRPDPEITFIHSLKDDDDDSKSNKTIGVLTSTSPPGSRNNDKLADIEPLINSSVLLQNEQSVTEIQPKSETRSLIKPINAPNSFSQINYTGITNQTYVILGGLTSNISITKDFGKTDAHIEDSSKNITKEMLPKEMLKTEIEPLSDMIRKMPNNTKNQNATPKEAHSFLHSLQMNDSTADRKDAVAKMHFENTASQNQGASEPVDESLANTDPGNATFIAYPQDNKNSNSILNETNTTIVTEELPSNQDRLSVKNNTEIDNDTLKNTQSILNSTSNLDANNKTLSGNLFKESSGNISGEVKKEVSFIEGSKNSSQDLNFVSNNSVISLNQSIPKGSGANVNNTRENSFSVIDGADVLIFPESAAPSPPLDAKFSTINGTLFDSLEPSEINITSAKESVQNETNHQENIEVVLDANSLSKVGSISNQNASNFNLSSNGSFNANSMKQINPIDENIMYKVNASISNQTLEAIAENSNATLKEFSEGTYFVSFDATNHTQQGQFDILSLSNDHPLDSNTSLFQNNSANSAEVQYSLSNADLLNITTEESIAIPNATGSPYSTVFDVNPTTTSAENFMSQNYLSLEAEEADNTTTPSMLTSSNFDMVSSAENFTEVYSTTNSPATSESIYDTTEKRPLVFQFRTPATIVATIGYEYVNGTMNTSSVDNDPLRHSLKDSSVHQAENIQAPLVTQKDFLPDVLNTNTSTKITLSDNQSSTSLSNISSATNASSSQFQNITEIKYENTDTFIDAVPEVSAISKNQQTTFIDEGYNKNQQNIRLAVEVDENGSILASNDTTHEKTLKTLEDYTVSPNWPDMDTMKHHPVVFETTFLQSDDSGSPLKQAAILTKEQPLTITSNTAPLLIISSPDSLSNSKNLRSNLSVQSDLTKPVSTYDEELQNRELEHVQNMTITTQTKLNNASITAMLPESTAQPNIQNLSSSAPDLIPFEQFDTGRSEMSSYSIPAEVMAQQLDVTADNMFLNLIVSEHIDEQTIDQSKLLKDISDSRNISTVNDTSVKTASTNVPPKKIVLVTEETQTINISVYPNTVQSKQNFNLTNSEGPSPKEFVTTTEPSLLHKTADEIISQHQIINATKQVTSLTTPSPTFDIPRTNSENIQKGDIQQTTPSLNKSQSQPSVNNTLKSSNETSKSTPISISAEQAALASATTADQSKPKDPFPCTNHGVYADKLDCHKYYLCVKQRVGYVKVTGTCAPRSAFSVETQRCSSDVSACYKEKCTSQIDFPDPLDDTSYFSCKEVRPGVFHMYHKQCGASLKFISNERRCGSPSVFTEVIQNTKIEVAENIEETTVETLSNSSDFPIILIEPDFKEIQATTTVYETAFIESFPVNSSSNFNSTVQGGGSTEPLMRTVRSTHSFQCYQDGVFANPTQCTEFYMCVKGGNNDFTQIIRKCPLRYAFHEKTKSCSRDLSVCPELWCRGHGNFPHPGDDNSYYRCVPNAAGGFRIYHILCEESKKFVASESACVGPSVEATTMPTRQLSTHDIVEEVNGVTSDTENGRITKRSTTASINDNSLDFQSKEEAVRTVVSEDYRKEAEERLRGILNEMRDEAARQHDTKKESKPSDEIDSKSTNSSSEEAILATTRKAFVCREAGRFADRFDCKKYFICSGKPHELQLHHLECRGSDRFDARKRICVDEEDAYCA